MCCEQVSVRPKNGTASNEFPIKMKVQHRQLINVKLLLSDGNEHNMMRLIMCFNCK